ncbi:MAG: TIGR01777 family protein [Caldilineae bacterium]|nr:MAG: TIGR01777 family protein [Caldilineae bacterium]
MKALVTGAKGLVGRRLIRELDGAAVLGRDPTRARAKLGDVNAFAWQPDAGPPPVEAFSGVDVIFHLAGEPVAEGRWTAAKKRAIRDSRVQGTRNLVKALKSVKERPEVLVVASAVGFYGDRGDEELVEDSAPAATFLAEVCVAWEAEALAARELGLRVAMARTGIVLAPEGGALPRMLPPFRLGLGGQLGNGRQWMPWIHVDDVVSLLLHAARTDAVNGPMNVVAPNPVTNKVFTKTLGQTLRRPAVLPVPRLVLRAAFGEMSEILMASQRALPKVAQDTGYGFRYPELRPALDACLGQDPAQ